MEAMRPLHSRSAATNRVAVCPKCFSQRKPGSGELSMDHRGGLWTFKHHDQGKLLGPAITLGDSNGLAALPGKTDLWEHHGPSAAMRDSKQARHRAIT